MSSPAIGALSYFQFGRESTWGTGVAATKRLPFVRHSIRPVMKQVRSQLLDNSYLRGNIFNVNERAEGQLETYLSYNDHLMLLDCAFGTATFGASGGSTTGAGPYTHVFVDSVEFHNSLTLQLIQGNIPAGKCQTVTGAKIVGFTIRAEAAGIVHVIYDIVGQRMLLNQTPTGGLSSNALSLVHTGHGSSCVDGSGDGAGTDFIMDRCEITFRNGVAPRERVSSAFIFEPIRGGFSVTTMKFRKEFRTELSLSEYLAGNNQEPFVRFTSGASAFIDFEMDSGKLVDVKSGVDDEGIIFLETEVESIKTAGSPEFGLRVTVVNSQATIIT